MNSLALQAVVDRWTTMSNEAAQTQNNRQGSGLPTGSSWFGVLMELYRVNEQYIQEVVDASRRILQIVLDGLVPGDHLKHTPVRSCFRILSGMIFILKVRAFKSYQEVAFISALTFLDLHTRCQRRRCTRISGPPGPGRRSAPDLCRRRCPLESCDLTITRTINN